MPTAISPALLGFGWFQEQRRWRQQERQDRYLLPPHLIWNHLQANGLRPPCRQCYQNQERQQCPSHAQPERWPIFSTTSVTAAPSIGWADKQPLTESRTWGHGPARRTTFSPSDAVSAANKFVAIQSFSANAPTLFRDLKSAESQPHPQLPWDGDWMSAS